MKNYNTLKRAPYDGSAIYSRVLEAYYDDIDALKEDVFYCMSGEGMSEEDIAIIDNLSDNEIVEKYQITMTKKIYCNEFDCDALIDTSGYDCDDYNIESIVHIDILDKLEELNELIRTLPSELYEDSYIIPVFTDTI